MTKYWRHDLTDMQMDPSSENAAHCVYIYFERGSLHRESDGLHVGSSEMISRTDHSLYTLRYASAQLAPSRCLNLTVSHDKKTHPTKENING